MSENLRATPSDRAAGPAAPFLELRDVSKTFRPGLWKTFRVLNGISLSLDIHQCTALLGHNGAGKTSAIRTLLGLIRPDRGEVLCDGRPMTTADRRRLGFMPEVSKLPADLTVEEILRFQLRLYGCHPQGGTQQLIRSTLEQVGLGPFGKRRIKQLSKGMARRVAWAQATIHGPEFLILDEPFSGLDPVGRIELRDMMTALKNKGLGMLVCTHELWTVRRLCDNLLILNSGRVVHRATRQEFGGDVVSDTEWDESRLMPFFKREDSA